MTHRYGSVRPPSTHDQTHIELETAIDRLFGTLTLPQRKTTAPVILLISGSGPTDRDGNSPGNGGKNDCLKLLAHALADSGFASVRYDKRGVGQSAAAAISEVDLRFEDYVSDAARWVVELSADPRFSGVVILGHSEGALIGLLAAQLIRPAAYISIAGPARKASDILRQQLAERLPLELATRNEAILTSLESSKTVDDVPRELMVLYRPSVQPYLISWLKYLPTHEIAKIAVPCLVLQGDSDVQVSVADAEQLGAAQPRCAVKVVRGMNHVLKMVSPDRAQQIASYGDPSLPIAPALIRNLTEFLSSLVVETCPLPPGSGF